METVTKREFDYLKEEVDHIKENVAILSNPSLLKKIAEARKRFKKGKGMEFEAVKKKILKD